MPIYNSIISGTTNNIMHGISFSRLGHGKKPFKFSPSDLNFGQLDLQENETKPLKRMLGTPRASLDSTKSNRNNTNLPADPKVEMTIESPPLVCYGSPKDSTGALLSGLIHLKVEEETRRFESFTMVLQVDVLVRRPVQPACADCTNISDEMNKWVLIAEPITLTKGVHMYPFSYLFPGHLPASNENALARISYSLQAVAIPTSGTPIHFSRILSLSRSILPGPEKSSIRIFPPTNMSATVTLPPVVHPGGNFNVSVRLDGVCNRANNTRWRLRKASWRIDESVTAISPACAVHSARLGGVGKGVQHEDIRTVGSEEVKRNTWKSDFSSADGRIELELSAGLPASLKAAYGVESQCGMNVKHALVVEMIVAEEYQPSQHSRATTATGAARVLRMQFQLCVTARSGLGISWDEEAPPMYEDVPSAPPGYGGVVAPNFQYAEFPPLEEVPSLTPSYSSSVASSSAASTPAPSITGEPYIEYVEDYY